MRISILSSPQLMLWVPPPPKPQAFWEMRGGVNHEEFASYESLLPLTMRPPDGEDKFARHQGGNQRPLSFNSPGSVERGAGLAPLADRIGCKTTVVELSSRWDPRTLEQVIT